MGEARSGLLRKQAVRIFGPAFILTVIGFVVAYQFVDPAPPRRITIATGEPEGAYYQFAQRYREILGRQGITLEVVSSAGSVENLRLLEAETSAVDIAFIQGGTESLATSDALESLGSVYFEPLWVFHRKDLELAHLSDLDGRRIAIGGEGSGTRCVALQLLEDNGLDASAPGLVPIGGQEAADALAAGEVDALFMIAAPESPVVDKLLRQADLTLMSFQRAEAYTRKHRFLARVVLPQGLIDFEEGIPDSDIVLTAPTANLVARTDFHPALVDLILSAAAEVHGPGGSFEKPGEFPSPDYQALPLSGDAQRHYQSGPPFLQRYLPFWAATLVDRLKVMLVPLLAMLIPFFRIMPPAYRWRVRSRIFRWYKELEAVDLAVIASEPSAGVDHHLANLDRIENEVAQVSVPLSYRDELYDLRVHIDLVRAQLQGRRKRCDGKTEEVATAAKA